MDLVLLGCVIQLHYRSKLFLLGFQTLTGEMISMIEFPLPVSFSLLGIVELAGNCINSDVLHVQQLKLSMLRSRNVFKKLFDLDGYSVSWVFSKLSQPKFMKTIVVQSGQRKIQSFIIVPNISRYCSSFYSEKALSGEITNKYCRSHEMLADCMIKPLPKPVFTNFLEKLNIS